MSDEEAKKVIILHNFDRAEYIQLLKSVEVMGISNRTIVAVTTSTTMQWKLRDLIDELLKEDEEIKK
jgi:hypothetical protein